MIASSIAFSILSLYNSWTTYIKCATKGVCVALKRRTCWRNYCLLLDVGIAKSLQQQVKVLLERMIMPKQSYQLLETKNANRATTNVEQESCFAPLTA